MRTFNFKRVYVWQLPVRVFHWVNALAITLLVITGFIIAYPPAILSNVEATNSYWFGTVKVIHFISAYIFIASIAMRFYWAFVGNRFARWKAYNPFSKRARQNFAYVLKIDVFLLQDKEEKLSNISIGHNAVAALAYMIFFLLFLIMIFTGFGLYQDLSTWWVPKMFAWVPSFLGGDAPTRLIHHLTMWLIILIAFIHVYLVLYHEWLEGRGEVSSMFSGYKFVRRKRINTK